MSHATGPSPLPEILVDEREYETLSELAAAAAHRLPDVARALLSELDRATVVETAKLPPGIVRLGSLVTYQAEAGETRQVSLVMPNEADISAGRISILTPIGTALFGLRLGQEISWAARDGRLQRLRIVAVHEPALTAV